MSNITQFGYEKFDNVKKVRDLINENKIVKALKFARICLGYAENANRCELLICIGQCLYFMSEYAFAEETLIEASKNDEENIEIMYFRAKIYIANDDYINAKDMYYNLLEKYDNTNVTFTTLLLELSDELKKYEDKCYIQEDEDEEDDEEDEEDDEDDDEEDEIDDEIERYFAGDIISREKALETIKNLFNSSFEDCAFDWPEPDYTQFQEFYLDKATQRYISVAEKLTANGEPEKAYSVIRWYNEKYPNDPSIIEVLMLLAYTLKEYEECIRYADILMTIASNKTLALNTKLIVAIQNRDDSNYFSVINELLSTQMTDYREFLAMADMLLMLEEIDVFKRFIASHEDLYCNNYKFSEYNIIFKLAHNDYHAAQEILRNMNSIYGALPFIKFTLKYIYFLEHNTEYEVPNIDISSELCGRKCTSQSHLVALNVVKTLIQNIYEGSAVGEFVANAMQTLGIDINELLMLLITIDDKKLINEYLNNLQTSFGENSDSMIAILLLFSNEYFKSKCLVIEHLINKCNKYEFKGQDECNNVLNTFNNKITNNEVLMRAYIRVFAAAEISIVSYSEELDYIITLLDKCCLGVCQPKDIFNDLCSAIYLMLEHLTDAEEAGIHEIDFDSSYAKTRALMLRLMDCDEFHESDVYAFMVDYTSCGNACEEIQQDNTKTAVEDAEDDTIENNID